MLLDMHQLFDLASLCVDLSRQAASHRAFRAAVFFFFNDTAPTEIYTLSLHAALPISSTGSWTNCRHAPSRCNCSRRRAGSRSRRSEEHTSELQSLQHLVCRLLLE